MLTVCNVPIGDYSTYRNVHALSMGMTTVVPAKHHHKYRIVMQRFRIDPRNYLFKGGINIQCRSSMLELPQIVLSKNTCTKAKYIVPHKLQNTK